MAADFTEALTSFGNSAEQSISNLLDARCTDANPRLSELQEPSLPQRLTAERLTAERSAAE